MGEGVTNVSVGDHVIPLYTAGRYSLYYQRHFLFQLLKKNAENVNSARVGRPISVEKVRLASYAHIIHTTSSDILPVRATQGKGLMPDETSRFSINGKPIHHFVSLCLQTAHVETQLWLDGNFHLFSIHRCGRRLGCCGEQAGSFGEGLSPWMRNHNCLGGCGQAVRHQYVHSVGAKFQPFK